MYATSEITDLSLFVPKNMPPAAQLADDYREQLALAHYVDAAYRAATAINEIPSLYILSYDSGCSPLDEAIQLRTGNCLTRLAFTAIAGYKHQEVTVFPCIASQVARNGVRSVSGYSIARNAEGALLYSEPYSTACAFDQLYPFDPRKNFHRTIADDPKVLEDEGIVQERTAKDGAVMLHRDQETRSPVSPDTIFVFTLFIGTEGLKSYLNTLEALSARFQQRPRRTIDNQLIPRL
jgi:hypothetical protein